MNIKIVAALLFLFLSFSSYLKADGFYSYSIGQFDVNDTFDLKPVLNIYQIITLTRNMNLSPF